MENSNFVKFSQNSTTLIRNAQHLNDLTPKIFIEIKGFIYRNKNTQEQFNQCEIMETTSSAQSYSQMFWSIQYLPFYWTTLHPVKLQSYAQPWQSLYAAKYHRK